MIINSKLGIGFKKADAYNNYTNSEFLLLLEAQFLSRNQILYLQPTSVRLIHSVKQRGTRRRCLLFEMGGGRKRSLKDDSNSPSDVKVTSDDRQLVPFKAGNNLSPCMVPGIGLHLNALAVSGNTWKYNRVVKHETLPSGKSMISMSSHITSLHSVESELQLLNKTFPPSSLERDIVSASEDQVMQDAYQASGLGAGEEFNESGSLRKRRRRFENGGDESCKRCNCKKSKCLRLYCECFAGGVYCIEPCSCLDCFNQPIQENIDRVVLDAPITADARVVRMNLVQKMNSQRKTD